MTIAEKSRVYTVGDLAERYRVPQSSVRIVVDRLELGRRVGRFRVVGDHDLRDFELGLKAQGFSPATTTGR